jgi:Tol biopolymer transport system component
MAIIDATGMHTVAAPPDTTMAQWDWGGKDAVVFTSERDGHVRHAFWMPMGGEARRITPASSVQEMPAVSPDGNWVAYSEYAVKGVQDLGLHLARVDGSHARGLTPVHRRGADIADTDPNFSPDGKWVAYAHVANWAQGHSAICVVRIDGSGHRCLTSYTMDAGRPRWSPDGSTILFSQGYHAEGTQLAPMWTVPAAGGTPTPLAKHPGGWSIEGDWSPDGTDVVYKYWQPGWDYNELRIVNVATGADRLLWKAPHGETAEMPDWQS